MFDEKTKKELEKLIAQGTSILYASYYQYDEEQIPDDKLEDLRGISEVVGDCKKAYHVWYAKASRCVRTLAPDRADEFDLFYSGKKNIKTLNYLDAGITHYLQGIVTTSYQSKQDYYGKFTSGITEQINIIEGIKENAQNILYHLETEIHFGLLKSEINVAQELKKHKQLRVSGALLGVVIENHLKLSCSNHKITFRKKNPTISDYNEALKKDNVIDTVMWRLISRCSDIRNYCVHSKEREPTSDEIDDLIRATEKIISEIS